MISNLYGFYLINISESESEGADGGRGGGDGGAGGEGRRAEEGGRGGGDDGGRTEGLRHRLITFFCTTVTGSYPRLSWSFFEMELFA